MKTSIRTCMLLVAMFPTACFAENASTPPCQTRETTYDSRDVNCALPATASANAWTFKAEFAGGHDDTMASMVVTLDDKPAACEGGGKLRLMGEYGNVSLTCRFPAGAIASAGALHVAIKWSHAEYVGAGVSAD